MTKLERELVDVLKRLVPALDTAAHLMQCRGEMRECFYFRHDAAVARAAIDKAERGPV